MGLFLLIKYILMSHIFLCMPGNFGYNIDIVNFILLAPEFYMPSNNFGLFSRTEFFVDSLVEGNLEQPRANLALLLR